MDEVDDLLTPNAIGESAPTADAWKATTRVLRRRRWWRRGRAGILMVGCFVAGALIMYRPTQPVTQDSFVAAPPEVQEADPLPMDAPRRLERWAGNTQGPKQRSLYRQAGDGFLKYGDEVAAIRCYRKALDGGTPTDLAIRTEDSWMMMSLKLARNHKE